VGGPAVSWHRGGDEFAASATLAAFTEAARRGAEWIELDVRADADGVLVCVHDAELPALGPVSDLRVGELGEDVRAGVLEFGRLLDALDDADPARRSGVHLDLKDRGYELAAVDAVLARSRALFGTTPIESSVRTLRERRPGVDAYLTLGTSSAGLSRRGTWRLRLGELIPMGRVRRCGATGVAVHHRLASPLTRWWCRRHGLAVVVWTLDGPDELRRWLARDVDVVTTNRPSLALGMRDASPGDVTAGR
jgi:glycerophosphoryl diester phosphodiesterase